MDKVKFSNLLQNIIEILVKQHIGFGKTRLIKLAYLIELEYYRRNEERLTDADWIYYKFGPYPNNYKDYIEHENITTEKIESQDDDFNFDKISLKDFNGFQKLPDGIYLLANKIIHDYGKEELNKLLDYVYYDTEPMINVESRGEILDFNTVLPSEYYLIKEFKNVEKVKKNILKKHKRKDAI
jgi:hypothetical protein